MKSKLPVIILFIVLIIFCKSAAALQIVYPQEGQIFYAGDEFEVIVKPDSGEKWEGVVYGISLMNYNPLLSEYKVRVKVPANLSGPQEIYVIAIDKATGKETKLIRNLFVKMPPNVVLKGIDVDNIETLFKLPIGSPEAAEKVETGSLNVKGIYSDGVKRELSLSASGTTYASSDETIVTVNADGKMIAQKLGRATITIKNGSYSATVIVIVEPYKK